MYTMCAICGAVIADSERHVLWHAMNQAMDEIEGTAS
jgi:hypothetical protein